PYGFCRSAAALWRPPPRPPAPWPRRCRASRRSPALSCREDRSWRHPVSADGNVENTATDQHVDGLAVARQRQHHALVADVPAVLARIFHGRTGRLAGFRCARVFLDDLELMVVEVHLVQIAAGQL